MVIERNVVMHIKVPAGAEHAQMMGPKQDDILLDVDGERVWGMASIAKAIINKRPGSVSLLGVP